MGVPAEAIGFGVDTVRLMVWAPIDPVPPTMATFWPPFRGVPTEFRARMFRASSITYPPTCCHPPPSLRCWVWSLVARWSCKCCDASIGSLCAAQKPLGNPTGS